MLVAQRKHLAATASTSPSGKPASSGVVTPSKRGLVKSQQMSPLRTAPRQTGTPTSLSQQQQQQRPHTSPLRARKAAVSNVTSTPTKVTTARKTLTERSKVKYLTMDELHRAYAFDYKVGSGNWASVWRVTQSGPDGKAKAAKLVDREEGRAARQRCESLMREFKCLRSIPPTEPWHPSIINFDDLILTPRYLCLIMPYYEHPMQVCVPLSTCRNYFEKLASAVSWLHRHYITHNDIKLVNTVVRVTDEDWDGTPVIVDFGFSTMHHPWRGTNFMTTATWGTPEYLSPERVAGRLHDERLSDIWALGVTFFEIATGRTPFERQDETFITESTKNEYYRRVTAGEWIIDDDSEYVPWELEDLCRCMLELDPKNRAKLQDIVQHEFFSPHASDDTHHTQTSFLTAWHEDDEDDEGLQLSFDRRRRAQQPFPSSGRRTTTAGTENVPRSATATPRKKVQVPTRTHSPKKQATALPITGYSPNVPAPFQPVHGSPLRQALQNAASRSNIQAQTLSIDRQLTTSTLGNHGSLDVSPVKSSDQAHGGSPIKKPGHARVLSDSIGTSPVKPTHTRVLSDNVHASPIKTTKHARVPSTSLIPQPIRQVQAVNIDDASHFDSDTDTESESESSSESGADIDEDEADVSHTSSGSDSDSDLASIIDLDDSPRRLGQASPSSSAETAPPGYSSAVGRGAGQGTLVVITDEEPTIRPQGSHGCPSAVGVADLGGVAEAVELSVPKQREATTEHEQVLQRNTDVAVQTDTTTTTTMDPNLTTTLDEIHLLAFHLLAKVQQARKMLTSSASETSDPEAVPPPIIHESLLSTQLDTSCLSLISNLTSTHAQPQASTPTRKQKEPDISTQAHDSPSAHSISTSRMGLREEVSWSTFGVVRDARDDEETSTTPAQENLQREITAIHSRSKSLFSVLDELREHPVEKASTIASLRASPISPPGSSSTVHLQEAGVQSHGQGLLFEPTHIPSVAMSPAQSRCTSPSLLQRGMSTLRKKRPRETTQQQQQHAHVRAFSASSLLSFAPVTPTVGGKSGLWRKLRGAGNASVVARSG